MPWTQLGHGSKIQASVVPAGSVSDVGLLMDIGLVDGAVEIPRGGMELRAHAVIPYLSRSGCS